MNAKDWFLEFSRGAALGTGILPGVSVGTVGLIVKVYDRLLEAISGLTKHFWKSVKALLPIALGCIAAALLLLFGYSRLKAYIPFEIIALMAGLILGGAPIIVKKINWKAISVGDILRIVLGFLFAAGIGVMAVIASKNNWFNVGDAFLDPNHNIWVYFLTFFVGIVTAVACLLPGISGSMVLFIFGLYNPVIGLYSGENSMIHNHDRIGTGLILTLILFVGVVIGLLGFAKIMRKLEEKHHQGTFTLVLGFVSGSLVSMFVNHEMWAYYESNAGWYHYLIGGALFVAGAILLFYLLKRSGQLNSEEEKEDAETARAE